MFLCIDKDKNTIILTNEKANDFAKLILKYGKIGAITEHKTRKELDAEISKFLKGELK